MKRDGSSDAIDQHKQMAQGREIAGQAQNFGAGSLHEGRHHEHMDAGNGTDSAQLGEKERSAPPPITHTKGKHPATAHSDHGPHQMHRGGRSPY